MVNHAGGYEYPAARGCIHPSLRRLVGVRCGYAGYISRAGSSQSGRALTVLSSSPTALEPHHGDRGTGRKPRSVAHLSGETPRVRRTLKQIAAEYGAVALVVYLAIFAVVLLGSWAAIHLGWKPESAGGRVGSFTAAYIATKLSQPLRIAATLALTPVVARVYERMRPSAARARAGADQVAEVEAAGTFEPSTPAERPGSTESPR